MRFDRNARRAKCPWISEFVDNRFRIVAAARGFEKAARRLQNLVGCGPAEPRQLHGDDARLRRTTGVERLRHSSEVLAQPSGLAGGDPQSPESLVAIKTGNS